MHITVRIWSWSQTHEQPKHKLTVNLITLWA